MARTLKIVGLAFAVVTGLLVLAVVGINLIPGDTYKALVASGAKSATGRDLVIEGDVDVHLFTTLGFKASGVRFANAGWGSRPQMASVDRIEGEVALLPLLRGVLDASLVLDNPDLLLETDTSGRANWEFKKSAGAPDTAQRTGKAEDPGKGAERGGGLFLRPLIRKLLLNGAHIAYLDGKNGTRTDVTGEILQIVTTGDGLAIELNGTCNDIPFAFTGGFDNAGHFVDNRPANARFEGSFGDAKLAVQGTAGPFAPTFDLDLSANVNAGSVAAFSVLAGRDLPDIGPLSATVKLTGKAGKYAVSDMRVALDDETLTAEAKGSVADLAGLNGLKLEAKADTGQLAEILQAFGFQSKFPLPDAFHAAVAAEGSLKDLAVKRFEARIEGRGLTVHAGAVVKNVIAMEGVKADISMETESLDLVAAFAKTELPSFGPIKLTAAIVSKGERLGRMEVRAELNGSTIHAEVAGSVGDPLRWKDVDADLNLGVDDLTFLSEYVNMKLPPLGRLRASATITSKGDTFAAKDIRADLAGGNIQAKVAGSVGDLRNLKAIHADVELAMESLSALSDVAKTALPPLGPLRASANITSNGDTFTAKDIRADLAGEAIQARVAGSVEDVLNLMGINADIHFSVDSLASLGSLVKQELPSSGPVSLDGKFSSTGGLEAPVNITAVVKSVGVSVNLTGRIAEPLAAKGVDLAVVLEAGSLQKLGWLAGTQLPDKNPVELEGRFTTGENNYELAGLHLRIGEFDVTGQAAYEPPSDAGGRPRVSGEFHAADLYLNKILAAADTSSETATPTKSKGSRDQNESQERWGQPQERKDIPLGAPSLRPPEVRGRGNRNDRRKPDDDRVSPDKPRGRAGSGKRAAEHTAIEGQSGERHV